MSEAKKRSIKHVVETRSLNIVKNILPDYWVIREYNPDYGIDLSFEIFEKKDKDMYITLGEHIYVQLKGTEHIIKKTYKIYERKNVEMGPIKQGKKFKEIDVVKFKLDVSELITIEKMGSGVPVLLFVVDVNEKCVYYLCLNDYIEKVIVPEDPNYGDKGHKVINIPCSNKIVNQSDLWPLLWYGKRAKMLALVNKVYYQVESLNEVVDLEEFMKKSRHFAGILIRYDFWSVGKNVYYIKKIYMDLSEFANSGDFDWNKNSIKISNTCEDNEMLTLNNSEKNLEISGLIGEYSEEDFEKYVKIKNLWMRINNVGLMLEDLWKEAYLPTYILNDSE